MGIFRKLLNETRFLIKYVKEDKRSVLGDMNYNAYHRLRKDYTLKPRHKVVLELIDGGSTVLDVGCGDGLLLELLSNEKHIKGFGVDISNVAVARTKEKGIDAMVMDIEGVNQICRQKYDYIVISEVLEHIANPEKIMLKVRDYFNKNLIVSIPNIGFYRHRLRLLLGRFPVQWNYYPGEHLRYWTIKDFLFWAKNLGFRIIKISPTYGVPVLYRYFPSLFSDQVVLVLERKW